MGRCLRHSNRLHLAGDKTQVVTFEQGVPMLGLVLRRHQDPFDQRSHVRMFLDPRKVHDVLAEVDTWLERLDPDRSLGRQFQAFNQRLRGWFEAFQYAYDASQAFVAIDQHLFVGARRKLKQLLGCSGSQLHAQYLVRLPSGHDSWQAEGEILMVLSDLPRKRYRPKARRLAWEPRAAAAGPTGSAPLTLKPECVPSELPIDLRPAQMGSGPQNQAPCAQV